MHWNELSKSKPFSSQKTDLFEISGVELVLDAARHIARGVADRTRGARTVLLDEMTESMEVPRISDSGKMFNNGSNII